MVNLFFKIGLLFIIVILVFYFVTDSFFRKDHFYSDVIENYQDVDNLDIAIFGSSHAHSSYDPRILELWSNSKVYNLGGPAQRLTATEAVADMVNSDHDIDLAIIDLFSVSFNEPDNERYKSLQLNSLDYVPLSDTKIKKLYETFGADRFISTLFPTINYHSRWNKISISEKANMNIETIDVYKGFRTNGFRITDDVWTKFQKKFETRDRPYSKKSLSDTEKQRVDDIISIFNEKNIPIVFVNAPSYVTGVETKYRVYSELIEAYIKELNYPFIDYNKLTDSLGLNKSHFKDPNHLNTNGAIIVSQHLKRFLKKRFNRLKKHESIAYLGNRYYHIETNFENTLYSKRLDSVTTVKTYGLKSAHLYRVDSTRFEIIFPLGDVTINEQSVRLEYDLTLSAFNDFEIKRTALDTISMRGILYGQINENTVVHYNGKSYAIFPFNTTLDTLKNVKFYAGDKRRQLVIDAPKINVN